MGGRWYLQNTVSATNIAVLLLLLVSNPYSVQAQCTYGYIQEPPPELPCNPYRFGVLQLACTVQVISPSPVQVDLSIEWYHVPSGQSEARLIAKSNFWPLQTTHDGFRSELIIPNVAEGSYYCQPVLAQGPPLLPSQSTRVDPFYSQNFFCNSILAVPSGRCAEEGMPPQPAPSFVFIPITMRAFASNAEVAPPPPTSPALIPGCLYQYVKEPPLEPTCNPYPVNELRLSCTLLVDASRVAGQLLIIEWLHLHPGNTSPISIFSSLFDLGTGLTTATSTFPLRVSNMQEGSYYCQPALQGGPPILPSKRLMLGPAGSHNSLPTCNGERVSVPSMRCAMDPQDHTNTTNPDNTMDNNTVTFNGSGMPEIPPSDHGATQEPTTGATERVFPDGSPNSTINSTSTSALKVWVYAIVTSGVIVLVCVGVIFSAVYCYRRKRKATAAKRNDTIGQTYPAAGDSGSIYSTSRLINRGQSEAPRSRTSSSQDHYYSSPQWPTSREDLEQSIASSEVYTVPRTYTYVDADSCNADGSGNCGGRDSGGYEVTTETHYSSLTGVTTGAERPIRAPPPACDKEPAGGAGIRGLKDCKSLPARPKPPIGAYQGLNVETMDYTSVYSKGVAPFSSQSYKALESSTIQPTTSYTQLVQH